MGGILIFHLGILTIRYVTYLSGIVLNIRNGVTKLFDVSRLFGMLSQLFISAMFSNHTSFTHVCFHYNIAMQWVMFICNA